MAMDGGLLSARDEEEVLGLLASFPDGGDDYGSSRELSFSDLVVEAGGKGAKSSSSTGADRGSKLSPGKEAAASRRQQLATVKDGRTRRQRGGGGGRGSCGGSGDGVLLNFYVPGLRLTRSMSTAPRPGAGQPAKATGAAVTDVKARAQAAPAPVIGCWPALWGRRRGTAKARS